MSRILEIVTDAASAGMRADRVISEAVTDLSRSYIQDVIANGGAKVGGTAVKSSFRPNEGDVILFEIPDPEVYEVVPQDIPLDILYEDSDIIVINKPKGMPVHPSAGHTDGTVVNAVMYHCGSELSGIGGVLRPGIVHRIDMNTTGSLVICKNDNAHNRISEQLKEHSIKRIYKGIVKGYPKERTGTVDANIGRDPKNRKRMAAVPSGGKTAVTHYEVIEELNGHSLCAFTLETGRTHQIRVHMSRIGHPLLGDDTYGGASRSFPCLEGQTLHAETLGFIHPTSGEYMEFTAPVPEYFLQLIERLRSK